MAKNQSNIANASEEISRGFTIADIHKTLGIPPTTQWRERRDGRLKFHRFRGRIRYMREDVDQYIANCKGRS